MRILIFNLFAVLLFGQIHLKYNENITPTYYQTIDHYQYLAEKYASAKLIEYGLTDIGKPLHLFVMSENGDFESDNYRENGKSMIMINNAIHPGEPCGVDASIDFANNLLKNNKIPKNVIIGIVPMYNIGGVLNRNSTTRVNQNGPKEYGFRGNARNLDLNRDFIKLDSENAKSIVKIFHEWKPDFFIDTHTTNGADHQHIMTMISPHPDYFPTVMQKFIQGDLLPNLYKSMEKAGYPMVNYVEPVEDTPESGLQGGGASPRFSSGYAPLFNTFSFTSEAHMLKDYSDRVKSTIAFLNTVLNYAKKHTSEIIALRKKADEQIKSQDVFTLKWKTDQSKYDLINFNGFEAKYKKSEVTGFDRLYYDRSKPWSKKLKYYNYLDPVIQVKKPDYYVLPQAWGEIIDRLKLNNIDFHKLCQDSIMTGEMYFIESVVNPLEPFNGHYPHTNIELKKVVKSRKFYKGDIIIPMNQVGNRYLIEALEPQGLDSFFRWNFFDSILDQREDFSPYIFEDTAADLLQNDSKLLAEFEKMKSENEEFAKSAAQQLEFIYKRSPNFEPDYRLYPVMRVIN